MFDDYLSFPSGKNQKELLEIMTITSKNEFLLSLSIPTSSLPTFDCPKFSLFLKTRNCSDLIPFSQGIFESLPESSTKDKIDDFFRKFSEQIIQKHTKIFELSRKNLKTKKISRRTDKFIEGMDNIFKELSFLKLSENNLNPLLLKPSFLLSIDSLSNFDPTNFFKNKDYLGHHLEFGYGDNTIFTPAETANGRLVDYRKINLSLNLEFKSGSIFVKLYEDFLREVKIDKNLVAIRNLDLFSNLSKNFIATIISNETKEDRFIDRYSNILIGLHDEEEREVLEEERDGSAGNKLIGQKYEIFSLFKVGNLANNNGLFETKNMFVFIKMNVTCENIKNISDLYQYNQVMKMRRDFLRRKKKKNEAKLEILKEEVWSLIRPFQAFSFDNTQIKIHRSFLRLKDEQKNKKCIIF